MNAKDLNLNRQLTRTGWLRSNLLRSDSGGAIVELAAGVTILVTILLGATQFAMLAYDSIEVSDAARAGVAYGSQSSANANNFPVIKAVAAASANDVSGLTTNPTVFYTCSSTPATHSGIPPGCGTGDTVLTYSQVATSAIVAMPIHIPGLSSYTLNGQAIMRVQ